MPQAKTNPARSRLDAMAREKGFPDYATWKAWNDKYRKTQTTTAEPKKQNFLQKLISKIPGHPSNTLGYVNDKMNKAMKK